MPWTKEQFLEQEAESVNERTEPRNEERHRVGMDKMEAAAEEAWGQRGRWEGNCDRPQKIP